MTLVLDRPRPTAVGTPDDLSEVGRSGTPGRGGAGRAPQQPLRPAWQRTVVSWWPCALALLALAVYVAAGWFMLYSAHYAIGDAMSRAEDARAVLFSRDPHLAAWGFGWFPGPVVLELPFMLVASPLNHAALAGPLTTAACGTLTVLVLVRLFRALGLSEPVVAGLTLTYCLNPVIIFYSANGMSEASFYLAATVFLLGIVQWFKEGGPRPLILMSLGLAAAMTIREEAIVLVPVVAVLVAFRERAWARRAKVATLVALPGIFAFALWTFANWLIMGNPLSWYDTLRAGGGPPVNAAWLPKNLTLASASVYSLGYMWAFVPSLFVVVPLLFLVVRSRRRRWELTAILGATAVIPGIVTMQLPSRGSWGDPRYFATLTIYASVLLGFAAREVMSRRTLSMLAKRALCVAVVVLGAIDAFSGTHNDVSPNRTLVEGESVPFRTALGLSSTARSCVQYCLVAWQDFDKYIDPHLSRGQLIMVDTGNDFPAPLFSRYPAQWVIPSDRDFAALADNFSGQFQWLLITPWAKPDSQTPYLDQALASTNGGHWKLTKYFGPTAGQPYRWVLNRSS
ncbi:MAG TPA: hypothetical protein VMS00_04930 [Acidimicrobiales bacterium]|nr:hypothetical protein [Acidimicrobiales bacterium]